MGGKRWKSSTAGLTIISSGAVAAPGFELAMMLRRAVQESPNCDGVVLGGHGLFTWGDTQQECYENTIGIIDQLGQFVLDRVDRRAQDYSAGRDTRRWKIGEISRSTFSVPARAGFRCTALDRKLQRSAGSAALCKFGGAAQLAHLGTSCPDHFIRTKVRPLFVSWQPGATVEGLREQIDSALKNYRKEYAEYYHSFARPDSPAMRDANPTVVLIPGIGMFSFGKSKTEARLTGEFYVNAIHVMEGATSMDTGQAPRPAIATSVRFCAPTSAFTVHSNYVALPPSEAFRIEYWQLEEAKIRRQPPEKELSRQVVLIVGGGSGIGREVALLAAERGAHVVVADRDHEAAKKVTEEAKGLAGKEGGLAVAVDIRRRDVIRQSLRDLVAAYGGLDVLINTAALFPSSKDGQIGDEQWGVTLDVNVTANYLLADEAGRILRDQNLDASMVLTSSANAVVPKRGSEAYDVSKAALSHLVRELAISLSPKIRVNGISPATVIKGSTMFPRDRVIASLKKYEIPYQDTAGDEQLRTLLAEFYAKRTLTHRPIDPKDCAEAILFLAGPKSPCTTGHIIPVDGGLVRLFYDERCSARSGAAEARSETVGRDRSQRPVLVAVDLGAESCRVSLLRWIDGQPEIRLVHRFANSARNDGNGVR
jgi:NAD(P)-dependent dehydrogenase (short-subunit alcohol dehydrogenase family)